MLPMKMNKIIKKMLLQKLFKLYIDNNNIIIL